VHGNEKLYFLKDDIPRFLKKTCELLSRDLRKLLESSDLQGVLLMLLSVDSRVAELTEDILNRILFPNQISKTSSFVLLLSEMEELFPNALHKAIQDTLSCFTSTPLTETKRISLPMLEKLLSGCKKLKLVKGPSSASKEEFLCHIWKALVFILAIPENTPSSDFLSLCSSFLKDCYLETPLLDRQKFRMNSLPKDPRAIFSHMKQISFLDLENSVPIILLCMKGLESQKQEQEQAFQLVIDILDFFDKKKLGLSDKNIKYFIDSARCLPKNSFSILCRRYGNFPFPFPFPFFPFLSSPLLSSPLLSFP